ncbi:ATP-binding protein [Sphaerisporangium dianthi]|uniref:ATP-binding protein n=1 Tax=Sphaerisporangium dianthi TaxID=1436120 RepID=A0ABV9CRV8_9ACTN
MRREAGRVELLGAGARVLQVLEREVTRVGVPLWEEASAQFVAAEIGAATAQVLKVAERALGCAASDGSAGQAPGMVVADTATGREEADDTAPDIDRDRAMAPHARTVAGFVTLASRVDQVGVARAFARELLAGCPLLEEALLVVSELASNSVQHSRSSLPGGTVTLYVLHAGARVRVEVQDDGADGVPCMRPAGSEAFPAWTGDLDEVGLRGRGLLLVEELATCWGFAVGHHRTTTWAELSPALPQGAPE